MKPYLFFISCLFTAPAIAQHKNDTAEALKPAAHYDHTGSEVLIGHGYMPSEQLVSSVGRTLKYINNTYSGAIFTTYRHHISRIMSIGITAAYEYEQGAFTDGRMGLTRNYYYAPGTGAITFYDSRGTFTRSSLTIAPEVTLRYGSFAKGHVTLYGAIGLGLSLRNEVLTEDPGTPEPPPPYGKHVHLNAYGAPLGIKAGGRLSAFFELGLGYKGVFNYGVSYRF